MNDVLKEWRLAKEALDAAKVKEAEFRQRVVTIFSTAAEMHSGTENVPTFGGVVKIVHTLDYKFKGDNDAVDNLLERIETGFEGGVILADRLVKWSPELSVSEYKKLPDEARKMVDREIVIKPASKSVKFVPN